MAEKTKSTTGSAQRLPPQNVEAERSVLGGILIDKNAIFRVADILEASDFYMPAHEQIFTAITDLYSKNQPIDVATLTNHLKEHGKLQSVGGSSYLAQLTDAIATASHIAHFAKIVKEKKVMRDLIRASAEIAESAFAPAAEMEDMLDAVEQKILSISQKSLPKNFIAVKDELKGAFERIERLQDNKGAIRGIPTGFRQMDNLLSGLQRSDLVIIGARPSLGKTSLALDIARNSAVRHGAKVGIFSLEMSREQVIDRIISAESNVPLWKLRTGHRIDDTEFAMIQNSFEKLSHSDLFIDDTASPNIMQMRAMARRLQIEKGLDMLVIDYLQLIMPRRNSDNMVHQITEISRGLKTLGRELNVPIVALSQLSRAVDQRDDKEPKLHDLRESGSIEQDADVVLFISRKDRARNDLSEAERNSAEVIIAKHRNGPLGRIQLVFDAERASFKEQDVKHEFTGSDEHAHSASNIDLFDDVGGV